MPALREEDLPPLTGSEILDPWRLRLRLQLRGELAPPPARGATRSELALWEALAQRQAGWLREHVTGRYRLDFYLPAAGLAVEVDGGSHFGATAWAKDVDRDAWHRLRGIRTLRVSDREVLSDLDGVLAMIDQEIALRALLQAPGVSTSVGNEVAVLREAAQVVKQEIRRIAAACETVLPELPDHPLLRWRQPGRTAGLSPSR